LAGAGGRGRSPVSRRWLVLGAKPEPILPPRDAFDVVACANASGYSAARLGLPVPSLTVLTALLTDGSAAGRLRIESLRGLATRTVHYYPQRLRGRTALARAWSRARAWRTTPLMLRRALARVGYRFEQFSLRSTEDYRQLLVELCHGDPNVVAQLDRKQASSGVLAVALALAEPAVERVIVSGFSFELTQAAGEDPNIARRGTTTSKHATTDIEVLRALAKHHRALVTTEPIVHAAAGVPLLSF
jgi:hypothetical protein